MEVLVTMTFYGRKEETSANLKGPLIFNRGSRVAAQIVLEDARYSTKHKVFK
jgi:flagellar assembly factor FliW